MTTNSSQSILIIANEEPLLTVMTYNLSRFGYVVNSSPNLNHSLSSAELIQPSIVIIDEDILSNVSLIEACTILKSKMSKDTFIVIMTKNKIDINSINFVIPNSISVLNKPFAPSALLALLKNNSTKFESDPSKHNNLEYNDIKMNTTSYQVIKNGKKIHLGPTEFKILQCLMELPEKTLTREHIMSYVWGHNTQVEPRTIDVHINRLRTALQDHRGGDDSLIKTVRSAGYCLSYENA